MGVHGLSGYLKRVGVYDGIAFDHSTTSPPPSTTNNTNNNDITTLAIDGDGLVFHLHRLAYREHHRSVVAVQTSSSDEDANNNNNSNNDRGALFRAQRLLPSLIPLSLADEVTVEYLTRLTTARHNGIGMHLQLYFDGPTMMIRDDSGDDADGDDIVRTAAAPPPPPPPRDMKRTERTRRRNERRRDDGDRWENVRQLCLRGMLPATYGDYHYHHRDGKKKKKKKSSLRSSAHVGRRTSANNDNYDGNNTNRGGGGGEEEFYLHSFPRSPLVLEQVRRSVRSFADTMGPILPRGSSVQIFECVGEADVSVAGASARDATGRTVAVGDDTDYLMYGFRESEDNPVGRCGYGEVRYLPFDRLDDPSSSSFFVDSIVTAGSNNGVFLTRSDVAARLGLPSSRSMVELGILMGNDYTGPFLSRNADPKRRKKFWESVRWVVDDDGDANADDDRGEGGTTGRDREIEEDDRLPPREELSWSDTVGIVNHVAEKTADGMMLSSDCEELRTAMEFSRVLYSFGNVSEFLRSASATTDGMDVLSSNASSEIGEGDDCRRPPKEEEEVDEAEKADVANRSFPSLPREFELSLARHPPSDVAHCALLPITTYLSEFGAIGPDDDDAKGRNDLAFVRRRHLDAFRMTVERNVYEAEAPRRPMSWDDLRALHVLERCLLEFVRGRGGDAVNGMPCRLFDKLMFHACLERCASMEANAAADVAGDWDGWGEEEEGSSTGTTGADSKRGESDFVLPIDEHEAEILSAVETNRVTIIHGETGCGKSSRVPCFLLCAPPPQPTPTAPEVKMIVSQPRRIAAKALAERVRSCEPDLADRIGLRMGHGVKEYETSATRAWFVTTGYVVRLLANYPGWFDSHTHLIIDEVHERSVDTDILCLLCRRLLHSHPTIRLVLMSATMAAELYSSYFGVPHPPIHVGSRRFPIREHFVEDLSSLLSLSPRKARLARDVHDLCRKNGCRAAPSNSVMEKLYQLAVEITASVGSHGSSVLIFVPGMSDIESIIELIERLNMAHSSFVCLPIHSDVPFEEQMAAFEPPGEGEVKVVIATNAAESSLTLPDVDHVICLGLCKQIEYNKASHRQMLALTWISRASATQRAGRTGRVREGNVYRLYSRDLFNNHMQPFEQGELVRTPLDSTILSLREMLNEAVTPILLECLEPPDVSTIDRSFQSLHASNFISEANDEGEITSLGSLVVSLGIDLQLGALVGLGIQFGVAAEAVNLAAILSFPKSPWAMSSPMYHDTFTLNEIVSKTFSSRCFYDAGLYSEPMAISNLLYDYSECPDQKSRTQFCLENKLAGSRMRHLVGTVESLKRRVADCLRVRPEVLEIKDPPHLMPRAKINVLRILQVWLLHDTLIVQNSSKGKREGFKGAISIPLDGPPIKRDHLKQILPPTHQFDIVGRGDISQQGHFDLNQEEETFCHESFGIRFSSYMLEKNINLAFYAVGTAFRLFLPSDIWDQNTQLRDRIMSQILATIHQLDFIQTAAGGNQRGRRGRACGAWYPSSGNKSDLPTRGVSILSAQLSKSEIREFKKHLDLEITKGSISSIFSCRMARIKKKNRFTLTTSGACLEVSKIDLCDLFASHDVMSSSTPSAMQQYVRFPNIKDSISEEECEHGTSNSCPLIEDAPEGARLMSVLASQRRRDNFIRFSNDNESHDDETNEIDVNLPKEYSINNGVRWKRKNSGGKVFVPDNCVPSAALPTDNNLELFCCCANTLDLRGGACRVEGLTMLPSGRLFIGLALLCFGINPRTGIPIDYIHEHDGEEKKEEYDLPILPSRGTSLGSLVNEVLGWIYEKGKIPFEQQKSSLVKEALKFHSECMDLGEKLLCQPRMITTLCSIFDGLDGDMTAWDGHDISLHKANAALRAKSVRKPNNETEKGTRKSEDKIKQRGPHNQHSARKQASVQYTLLSAPSSHVLNKAIAPDQESEVTAVISMDNNGVCTTKKKRRGRNRGRGRCRSNGLDGDNGSDHLEDKFAGPQKPSWICPGCQDVFLEREICEMHIEKCSFGLVKHCAPSPYISNEAIVPDQESGVTADKSMDIKIKCVKKKKRGGRNRGRARRCSYGLDDDNVSVQPEAKFAGPQKTSWVCPGCQDVFLKQEICEMHIEKCSFGLVKHLKPKAISVACDREKNIGES